MDSPVLAQPLSKGQIVGDWLAGGIYKLGLWHPYFRLKRSQGGGCPVAILTFHRIVDDDTDYLYKGPTVHTHVELFEQLISAISRFYDVLSLDDVVGAFKEGRPFSTDSVAITFDDGYEDTFRLGLPILRRYRVPATVFVATGFTNTSEAMWTDRVEQALLHSQKEALKLDELGGSFEAASLPIKTTMEKRVANATLARKFKGLDSMTLSSVVGRLEDLLEPDTDRYARTMMNWDELRGLHRGGVEIGSHGVTHNIMTRQEFAVARDELRLSKEALEDNLGITVKHFAFPNGRSQDFSPELVGACRELGYESICSAEWGLCQPGVEDRYFLKRVALTRTVPRSLLALEGSFFRWHRSRKHSKERFEP